MGAQSAFLFNDISNHARQPGYFNAYNIEHVVPRSIAQHAGVRTLPLRKNSDLADDPHNWILSSMPLNTARNTLPLILWDVRNTRQGHTKTQPGVVNITNNTVSDYNPRSPAERAFYVPPKARSQLARKVLYMYLTHPVLEVPKIYRDNFIGIIKTVGDLPTPGEICLDAHLRRITDPAWMWGNPLISLSAPAHFSSAVADHFITTVQSSQHTFEDERDDTIPDIIHQDLLHMIREMEHSDKILPPHILADPGLQPLLSAVFGHEITQDIHSSQFVVTPSTAYQRTSPDFIALARRSVAAQYILLNSGAYSYETPPAETECTACRVIKPCTDAKMGPTGTIEKWCRDCFPRIAPCDDCAHQPAVVRSIGQTPIKRVCASCWKNYTQCFKCNQRTLHSTPCACITSLGVEQIPFGFLTDDMLKSMAHTSKQKENDASDTPNPFF
jgi:hypothetical protein